MIILYEMPALFPFGTPYASRVLNFSRMLKSMGHKVIVFCDYISNPDFILNSYVAEYEGIEIHYTSTKRNFYSKATVAFRTPIRIQKYLKNNHVDLLIADSGAERFQRILRIAKKNHLPLILETCEKYHHSNWKFGYLAPRCWHFNYCWRFVYKKSSAVIAISRYLSNHFFKKGLKTIRIPTILDVSKIPFSTQKDNDDVIKFVFSGALGHGKDSLVEFMLALNKVKSSLKHSVELNIYGPTMAAIKKQLGKNAFVMSELDGIVHYHGRIPQNQVQYKILENDFGLILRPERESSNAGFPTKLAEYMSAGLAVLANDTGDIGLYLNSSNGFLLKDKKVESIEKILLVIDNLSNNKISDMRKFSRETAEKKFDFHLYYDKMSDLLKCCLENFGKN